MSPWEELNTSRIVLVSISYNDKKRLSRFIEGLSRITYPHFRFVLVDNHSCDGSVDLVRACWPAADVIILPENRGSAGAYNAGIQRALELKADLVMTLATDMILDPACLAKLVQVCTSNPKIGAVSPLLFYSDQPDTVQMYGGSIDMTTGKSGHDFVNVTEYASLPDLRDSEYLDGGSMLVRADVLRKVGGFDEKLFIYAEDNDLSYRIQRAGYRTVAVRDAWSWHYHRADKGFFPPPYEVFYITRNRFYLVRKHGGRRRWIQLVGRTCWYLPRWLFYYLRRGKIRLASAYLAGTLCGIAGRMGRRGWVDSTATLMPRAPSF